MVVGCIIQKWKKVIYLEKPKKTKKIPKHKSQPLYTCFLLWYFVMCSPLSIAFWCVYFDVFRHHTFTNSTKKSLFYFQNCTSKILVLFYNIMFIKKELYKFLFPYIYPKWLTCVVQHKYVVCVCLLFRYSFIIYLDISRRLFTKYLIIENQVKNNTYKKIEINSKIKRGQTLFFTPFSLNTLSTIF